MERIFLILWHTLCSELGYVSAAVMRSRHFGSESSLIARFTGPKWGPSGADRTQVGPIWVPLTLLSGMLYCSWVKVFPNPNGYELFKMFYNICECVPRFVTHYWCVSMELQKLVGYVKIHYLIIYSWSSQAWAKIFITQMCRFAQSSGRMKTRFFSCITNFITCDSKRKPPCIGGMELVSLSCNRVFISAESVGRGWCKIAIAKKWYQFHATDKCGYLFMPWITDQLHICAIHKTSK